MGDFGAYRNSEGYADPTAYEAVCGMAKPGEIWTYKEREVLIVKNQGTYCNILQLGAFKKGCIEVAGRYANPGMLSYAFNDLLTECVQKLTSEEFEAICEDVADALEIDIKTYENFSKTVGPENNEQAMAALREATAIQLIEVDPEKEALRAKVELLQNMYNDLLGKVIAKVCAF